MSVVPIIIFVLALFALVGLVAWGAVLQATYVPRTSPDRTPRTEASRELADQRAS